MERVQWVRGKNRNKHLIATKEGNHSPALSPFKTNKNNKKKKKATTPHLSLSLSFKQIDKFVKRIAYGQIC